MWNWLTQPCYIFFHKYYAVLCIFSLDVSEDVVSPLPCEHWQLQSFSLNANNLQGFIRDVSNDVAFDPTPEDEWMLRGINIVKLRRSWSGCVRSEFMTFDTHTSSRPSAANLAHYLRAHLLPGDVILAASVDEASGGIDDARAALAEVGIDVSSLGNR